MITNKKLGNGWKKLGNGTEKLGIKETIRSSTYSQIVKNNLYRISDKLVDVVFGNKDISLLLSCSDTTATDYIKKLVELGIVEKVVGKGAGKYILKE